VRLAILILAIIAILIATRCRRCPDLGAHATRCPDKCDPRLDELQAWADAYVALYERSVN
jgi:hypothetical protein